MSGKVIEIVGLNELIADMKRAGARVEDVVMGALRNSTRKVQMNVRERAPHVTGTLQRSVLAEINYPEGIVEVQEKYGEDVEYGRGPTNVSPTVIQRWAKKKGIPESMVWPIIQTIRRKGTKAHPFFEPGWTSSQEYIADQFEKVGDKLLSLLEGRR